MKRNFKHIWKHFFFLVIIILLMPSIIDWTLSHLLNHGTISFFWIIITYIAYISVGFIILGNFYIHFIKKNGKLNIKHFFYRLLLPRLIGGIIVGYVVVTAGAETWKSAVKYTTTQHWSLPLNWVIYSIALIATISYIYMEILTRIKHPARAFKRAVVLLTMGLFESFIIGIIYCDLFGNGYIGNIEGLIKTKGLFGHIYPQALIVFVPMALFVGVFVQLIWEEKPLTGGV